MVTMPLNLGEFRDPLTPYLNAAIQRATEQGMGMAVDASGQAFARAVDAATSATSKQLVEIARAIDRGLHSADFANANRAIGAAAQRSVLASYDQTVGRSDRSGASGYRQTGKFKRYSGGRLRAALASPDFWHADETGIYFINVDLLNQQAAQWARINFGAGARGHGSRRSFDVRFSDLVVVSLGLNEGARPAFTMPTGYFTEGANGPIVAPDRSNPPGRAFYVYGTGPHAKTRYVTNDEGERVRVPVVGKKATQGIRARNFLDAGVARIARETPVQYKAVINKAYEQGLSVVRPSPVTIKVVTHRRY